MEFFGGVKGSRTPNPSRATDFKSVAYTSSATTPYKAYWGQGATPGCFDW